MRLVEKMSVGRQQINGDDPSAEPMKRRSQVDEWVITLSDSLSRVREKANHLRERLGPVLSTKIAVGDGVADQPAELVELADALRTINWTALDVEAVLDSIADRLEL